MELIDGSNLLFLVGAAFVGIGVYLERCGVGWWQIHLNTPPKTACTRHEAARDKIAVRNIKLYDGLTFTAYLIGSAFFCLSI